MKGSRRNQALLLTALLLVGTVAFGAHTAIHPSDLSQCPLCLNHNLQGHAIAPAWSAPALLPPTAVNRPPLVVRLVETLPLLGFNARAPPFFS